MFKYMIKNYVSKFAKTIYNLKRREYTKESFFLCEFLILKNISDDFIRIIFLTAVSSNKRLKQLQN
jgi:hypothetical protein